MEEGGSFSSGVQGQPGQRGKTLSQKGRKNREEEGGREGRKGGKVMGERGEGRDNLCNLFIKYPPQRSWQVAPLGRDGGPSGKAQAVTLVPGMLSIAMSPSSQKLMI